MAMLSRCPRLLELGSGTWNPSCIAMHLTVSLERPCFKFVPRSQDGHPAFVPSAILSATNRAFTGSGYDVKAYRTTLDITLLPKHAIQACTACTSSHYASQSGR